MTPRSIGFWTLWVVLCLLIASCFVLNFRLAAAEHEASAYLHRTASEENEDLAQQLEVRQRAVDALRADLAAIDLSAREEYRLVRPGERMELIEIRHLGPADSYDSP